MGEKRNFCYNFVVYVFVFRILSIVNVWDVNHWVGQQVCTMFGNKIDSAGAGKLEDDPHKGIWTF